MIQETPEIRREFERAWEQVKPPAGQNFNDAPTVGADEWVAAKCAAIYAEAWEAAFPGVPCLARATKLAWADSWNVIAGPADEAARGRLLELLDARIEARKQARREEALEEVCAYV